MWCFANEISVSKRADFGGGIKTSIDEMFQPEFFVIDSGTRPDSAIPSEVVERRKLTIHSDPQSVSTANGLTTSRGFILLYVKLDLREFDAGYKIGIMKCYVVDGIDHILIGLKDIARFRLDDILLQIGQRMLKWEAEMDKEAGFNCFPVTMDAMLPKSEGSVEHSDSEVERILSRYESIFQDKLQPESTNAFDAMDLRLLDPSAQMPRALQAKARPQPAAWAEEISRQLQEYVGQGIIEPCSSTFWSQVLMVKKQDGKLRLCVDYRVLNKLLKHEGWQLPNINELLRKLGGKQFFGKVDMTQGYHQVALGAGQELTAFRVNGCTYKFKKVPFGLQSAPPYFAFQMQTKILNGLEDICLVYLDDVIIFGESREEYLGNMEMVLARFEERGILIKRSKCTFCVEEIGFLGHIINGQGIQLSDDRKASLRQLPLPVTITQLRSFLGAANYFRQFIGGYATLARDLHQLAAKSPTKILNWNPELKRDFEQVKAAVVEAPSLKFLSQDTDDEIILYTDASDYAFGGFLVQRQKGVEEPILFYSKSFNTVQARWSVSDKEMFSIVHGVLANHHLLMGRKFTVRSDHKALMYNDRVSASNKIERWKVSLSEYDIRWEYIEGEKNVVADCLSRVVETDSAPRESDQEEEPFTVLVLSELSTQSSSDVATEGATLAQWQTDMIKTHHAPCHFNAHDTLKSLKAHKFEWRGMESQVKAYSDSCKLCQMIKTRTHPSHSGSFSIKSDKPGEKISLDIMEYNSDIFDYTFIMVIVDCFHGYTTLIPLKTIKTGNIYHALIQYFCNDGIPDIVCHDLGASLNAVDVKTLLRFLNINTIVTTARNSQENGIAEQKISRVRQVMKLLLEEQDISAKADVELTWSLLVPFCQRAINVMTGPTGYSAAEIRFGLYNRLDGIKEILAPPEIANFQTEMVNLARDRLVGRQNRKNISHLSTFKNNELVIIKNPVHLKRNVGHNPYLGPFKVTSQDNNSVTITLATDPTIIKRVKTSEVFRFKDNLVPLEQVSPVPGLSLVPAVINKTI